MPSGAEPFNDDVAGNDGYRYTTNAGLSSLLANERLTAATLDLGELRGRTVIDVGCGDGAYTAQLAQRGQPSMIVGIDPAVAAVDIASQRHPGIRFEVGAADWLEQTVERFDVAIARGVLHHADDPAGLVSAMSRVAESIILLEPNGRNPVLKLIERTSSYHRDHQERSFRPAVIDAWLRAADMKVEQRQYVGLVPFFFPAIAARILKKIEPVMERMGPDAMMAVYALRSRRS